MGVRVRLQSLQRYPKEAWILAVVIVLVTMSTGSTLTPVLPNLKAYFALSGTAAALVFSFLSLARMAVDLPAGLLVDRFRNKSLLVGGIVLTTVGAIFSFLAPSYPVLLAAQLITGAGVNTCLIAAMVSFSGMGGEDTRGRLFGLYNAAVLASSFIGPIVAGELAAAAGWRAVFVYMASAATAAGILAWLKVSDVSPANRAMPSDASLSVSPLDPALQAGQAALWLRLVPLYLLMFFYYLGSSGISHSAIPIYASETLGLETSTIGWAIGIAMLFRSLMSLVGGQLGDRYGHRIVITLSFMVLGVTFLAFNRVSGAAGFLGGMLFIGIGHVASALPNAWLVDLSPRERWGTSLGISRLGSDLAHVIGPVAILFVFDRWNFAAATLVGACIMWLNAFIAGVLVPRPRVAPTGEAMAQSPPAEGESKV